MSNETENTHFLQPKITGYRQLSEEEAALVNEAKALAEQCGQLVAKLRTFPPTPPGQAPYADPGQKPTLDQRAVSIGATELQTGFMWLVRGIAQPTTF